MFYQSTPNTLINLSHKCGSQHFWRLK